MIELALENVEKYYGALQVLKGVSFEVQTGEKVGIVGRNGTGKTTIFKLLSGEEPFQGQIHFRKGLTLGYLQQIPQFPAGYTVQDVLNEAFAEHLGILRQLHELEEQLPGLAGEQLTRAMDEYGRLQQQFELIGGYELEAKLGQVRTGLAISEEQLEQSFDSLSGGEKSTVLLARVLLEEPDLLLLDEPSNHLDFQALEWLEDYLAASKQTVLVISHDRYFLDKAVNRIIEIEDGRATSYLGNFTSYTQQKEQQLQEQLAAYQNQAKKIKAMEKAIRNLKDWGNRADNPKFHKRAASMQKRLDKMERVERPDLDPDNMHLDFGGADRTGRDVITAQGVVKCFGQKRILDRADLHVRFGERVAVVGRNGAGKSTLLKTLMGELTCDQGEVRLGANVKAGYLEQEVHFADEQQNLIASLRDIRPMTEGEARQVLAKYLFFGEDVFKRVGSLSGGEKSRLRLCHLVNTDVNVLILDEPTNHLDIPAIEALETALEDFAGTILFVSHDRYFINKLAQRVVELEKGKLFSYPGDYDYYRTKKQQERLVEQVEQPARKRAKLRTERRLEGNDQQKRLQLEKRIAELEVELDVLNVRIAQAATDYERLQELYLEKQRVQTEYDDLLEKWVHLA